MDHSSFVYSNNMLYPKEDKDNKILLYAVSGLECASIPLDLLATYSDHWFSVKSEEHKILFNKNN